MAENGLFVNTSLGKVKGNLYKTERGEVIYSFQGIPYAEAPVGALRFKNPVPKKPWTEVKSAEKDPPRAPAAMPLPDGTILQLPGSSEDCLYVNVYTPQVPQSGNKVPVMVFIHGGGFNSGTGNMDFYGPDYLVPKGVILVTINYRVGAFGFLSLKTPECPGNYGLKDQVLGLKWVQENIGAFGGDSQNVTVFGESAGGASVQYLMLSPTARGLFQRAIAQSGSVLNRWAYSRHPVESAKLLAERLGYKGDDLTKILETIQNAPTFEILSKSIGIFQEIEGQWEGEHLLCFPFVPTVEPENTPNAFLTKTPQKALDDGDSADIPYITGVCADEMIFCLPKSDYVPKGDDDLVFQKLLPKELEIPLGSPKMVQASKMLKEFYFPNGPNQKCWIQALSMLHFTYGVFKTAENYTKNLKAPTYLYRFTGSRSCSGVKRFTGTSNVEGTCHGDDLGFLFTATNPVFGGPAILEGTWEDATKETITKLWIDFAKTGKVDPVWPVSDPQKNYPYLEIGESIAPNSGFFEKEIKFWEELYAFLKE